MMKNVVALIVSATVCPVAITQNDIQESDTVVPSGIVAEAARTTDPNTFSITTYGPGNPNAGQAIVL